jgi:hypothetical protein
MAREPWLMELGCESGESVAGKRVDLLFVGE